MKMIRKEENGVIVYEIGDVRIDSSNIKDLRKEIEKDLKENVKILLNLNNVEYMDSTALSILVFFHKEALKKNAKFKIVTNNEKVLSIFITTGLIRALEIFKSFDEAMSDLENE